MVQVNLTRCGLHGSVLFPFLIGQSIVLNYCIEIDRMANLCSVVLECLFVIVFVLARHPAPDLDISMAIKGSYIALVDYYITTYIDKLLNKAQDIEAS